MESVFSRQDRRLLMVGALVALVIGVWVVGEQPTMDWAYLTLVTAVFALAMVPIAGGYGHIGEGAIAVWAALWLGPLAFPLILIWVKRLPGRAGFDDESPA